jgi:hypothetical protein
MPRAHLACLFPQAGPGKKHEREAAPQQRLGLLDEPRIACVHRNPQLLRAVESRDVTVAQVQPQQLGVVRVREPHAWHRPPAARTRDAPVGTCGPPADVADGGAREAEAAGDLAVIHAG